MKSFAKTHFYRLLILAVVVILFIFNYTHGTFLAGWDNMQTDLYPWLGVKRAFLSAWEEYQSFGLVAGMAHAADLPRAVFIWLLSFVLPQNMLRYFYHFFMLLIGGLGTYELLAFSGAKKKFAFSGALFYLLNLGTIQMFYLPYEAFTTFFGMLPFEIWIFLKLVTAKSHLTRKELLVFSLINFLATPQAYVQTLFLVYALVLGCVTLGLAIEHRQKRILFRSALLGAAILAINSYWLLPQLYFVKTSVNVVREAKINQFNETTYYQNIEKGTVNNLIQFKGYYFDLSGLGGQRLFLPWQNHMSKPLIQLLPYCFAFIIIAGLFYKKRHFAISFVIILLLGTTALLTATFPFSLVNVLARHNSLIDQIFRSPFTKFIFPFTLACSYLFAFGVAQIEDVLHKIIRKKNRYFVIAVVTLLTVNAFPAFQGYFVSPQMKVAIPSQYLELMSYLKQTDTNQRIALLPDYTFWGWFFTKWGYNGSGFLWYGIEQPIVSRTFDVWSDKSEGYYWEIEAAINSEDVVRFQRVLDKYNIGLLVVDDSLVPVSSSVKGMQYDRIRKLLADDNRISLLKKWNDLSLYQVKQNRAINSFTSYASSLPVVGPDIKVTDQDTAYSYYGDYRSAINGEPQSLFPFLDFTSQTIYRKNNWLIGEDPKSITVTSPLGATTGSYNLIGTRMNRIDLYIDNTLHSYSLPVQPVLKNNEVALSIPKALIKSYDLSGTQIENCGSAAGKNTVTYQDRSMTVTSMNKATACFSFPATDLEQRYGYLIKIRNKNIAGQRLFFYIKDETKQQSYLEARLRNDTEYIVLPNRYRYGVGYSLVFQNSSYENSQSVNELLEVSIFLLPVDSIKNIQLADTSLSQKPPVFSSDFTADKKSYYLYTVSIPSASQNGTVVLSQSFSPGWKAYQIGRDDFMSEAFPFFYGKGVKNHVVVNNWANGWLVDNNEGNPLNLVILFWPQYLEFFGISVAIVMFCLLACPKLFPANRKKHDTML